MATTTQTPQSKTTEFDPVSIFPIAPTRPTVSVVSDEHPDGKLYELRLESDFGARGWTELQRDIAARDAILSQEEPSDNDYVRLEMLTGRMAASVLDAPSEVLAQLSYPQQTELIIAFQVAPFMMAQQKRTARPTGSKTATKTKRTKARARSTMAS